MKKQICAAVLAASTLLSCFLTGCLSFEDRENAKQYEKQASENAVEYLNDKYDFDSVKIKKSEAVVSSDSGGLGTTVSGNVLVTVKCDGETFTVFIDGKTANTDGADDYQTEEIMQDIKQTAGDILQNEIVDVELSGGVSGSYFEEYYDGDLSDIISENDNIILSCVDESISESDMSALKDSLYAEQIMLLNFNSKSAQKSAKEKFRFIINDMQLDPVDVCDFLIDLEDYSLLQNGEFKYYTVQRIDYQDLSIIGTGTDPFELDVTESDLDFCFEGRYGGNYELLGNACHIESDAEYMVIFCKRDEIPKAEDGNDVEFAVKEQGDDYRTVYSTSFISTREYDTYLFDEGGDISIDAAHVQQVDS